MKTLEDVTGNYLTLKKLMEYLGDENVLNLACLNKTIIRHIKNNKNTREMAKYGAEYEDIKNKSSSLESNYPYFSCMLENDFYD